MGFNGIFPLAIQHDYGNSPCLMDVSTISMAVFRSYVKLPNGKTIENQHESPEIIEFGRLFSEIMCLEDLCWALAEYLPTSRTRISMFLGNIRKSTKQKPLIGDILI